MASDGSSSVCGVPSGTGLVYDEKLLRHYCAWNPAYTERPERLEECYKRIQQLGLVERCVNVPVRPATDEEAGLCHTRKHMELLKETEYMTMEQLSSLSRSYDFVYFHKTVEENSRLALGGAVDLVDQVLSGKLQNGMAVIRPPGHHAMSEQFCGYCYFNNVAVTARTALQKHGLKRILIVDWDVHHGQGTQFDFYDDPRVLFFSIHRYEHGVEWPHLRESDYDYIGEGRGKGYNINVPLNEIGCDNSDYLSIFFNVLLPVAYEFQPELILVSAGYDSAIGCPEGQMSVTPACFAHFVQLLRPLAEGKLVLLLEGGYCLRTLAEAAALSLRALLGDPTPNITPLTQPRSSVVESILNTVTVQRATHPSLAYQDTATEGEHHNFRWQRHSTPQEDIELRTRDQQPKDFPLIQQCCESISDGTQEAINKTIEQLEKDTILASTHHRLGISHYQLAGPENGKTASLEEILSQRGLLSSCFRLSSNSSLMKSRISAVLAAILDDTVQSCVMLPCSSHARGEGHTEYGDLVKTTADCLISDFHVKRTLYLNLTLKKQPFLPSISAEHNRSLVISVGECGPSDELSASCQPVPLSVPLSQSQFQDADIVAAVQQIVLPVAYEFGPDFVVVCLDSLKHDLPGGLSASCVGHLMTMVHGLARGRLLLLVSPEAVTEMKETVVECVSVLQGHPCQPLPACVPQSSTVQLIKDIQDRQKSVWKMLQFREKLPALR